MFVDYTPQLTPDNSTFDGTLLILPGVQNEQTTVSRHSPVGGWAVGFRPDQFKLRVTMAADAASTQFYLLDADLNRIGGDGNIRTYPAGTHEYVFDTAFSADILYFQVESFSYEGFAYQIFFMGDEAAQPPPPNTHGGDNMSEISSAWRMPGAYLQIDGTMAGLNSGTLPNLLLVGLRTYGSASAQGEILPCGTLADAAEKFGERSMVYQMAQRFFAIDPPMNLYVLPFSNADTGAAATATIEVTAAATAAGTLSLYLGGVPVSVPITDTLSTAQVAAAINAAITGVRNFQLNLPIAPSVVAGSTVTLTAQHTGVYGNSLDLRINAAPTDRTPAGLVVDITGFSGGTLTPLAITNENIAAIFDNDDSGFLLAPSKYIALGLNDDVTMAAFHAESQRRYAPPIQSGFRIFTAFSGGYTDAMAYGNSKNYEHICCVALNGGLTTVWETAAIVAATAAPAMYDNPVRSLEGLALKGLRMALPFTFAQSNSLLYAGLSQVQKSRDGSCSIKRLISMYLHRADDSLDDAYLDINTTEVMERIRYEQRMGAIKRFTGKAVARTDEGYRPGLPIITLDTVRAYLLTMYKDTLLRDKGWVQNYEYYKSTLLLEQDPVNPSRFNYTDQPVILSPFYILAGRAQFRKEVQ